MACCSDIKMNEALINAAKCVNLKALRQAKEAEHKGSHVL